MVLALKCLFHILCLCFVFLFLIVLFLSLEHLVTHSAYYFVKPIIGDHLRLMFYFRKFIKLSILNIGLFISFVLLNLACREQNKDCMQEQITLSSNTTFENQITLAMAKVLFIIINIIIYP